MIFQESESQLAFFGNTPQARVHNAIVALKEGLAVVVLDDHQRENEGDLLISAEKITPQSMNFLIRYGSGIACLTLPPSKVEALALPMMVQNNQSFYRTAFTVSIEARTGVTTGVSAKDRVHTIRTAIADYCQPEDLVRPGHVFPLRAAAGGVFERPGHTEASIDLLRLAGLKPAGVLCELMNPDGSMARLDDCAEFARTHSITIVTIADLISVLSQSPEAIK